MSGSSGFNSLHWSFLSLFFWAIWRLAPWYYPAWKTDFQVFFFFYSILLGFTVTQILVGNISSLTQLTVDCSAPYSISYPLLRDFVVSNAILKYLISNSCQLQLSEKHSPEYLDSNLSAKPITHQVCSQFSKCRSYFALKNLIYAVLNWSQTCHFIPLFISMAVSVF